MHFHRNPNDRKYIYVSMRKRGFQVSRQTLSTAAELYAISEAISLSASDSPR